jgi:hypothetical protein
MSISRRKLLQMGVGSSVLALPNRIRASSASNRKFLFVFCTGGWDQCYMFAPLYNNTSIDMEPESTESTLRGIRFVDSEEKPYVRQFFERFGDKTCMINGFEARSVAHDICLRLVSTGSSLSNRDDWPSIIAAHAQNNPLMPFVNLSGPLFTHDYTSSVVRVGSSGQFSKLLSGEITSDQSVVVPQESVQNIEDLWIREASMLRLDEAKAGREFLLTNEGILAEDRLQQLRQQNLSLIPSIQHPLASSFSLALDLLESDTARSVMLSYNGVQNLGWDTHAGSFLQALHFNELFKELLSAMDELSGRQGSGGGRLSDEVTVVLMSEMGRFPQENARGGKEHWTYTSALLIGSGVQGGQTIGGYDSYCFGQKVNLATGSVSDNGVSLLPGHFGATLLHLADIESSEFVTGAEPIWAAIQ